MPIEDTKQLTHRQHAVPQNILDVEFKIIGDLTMRQFFYILIFGALGYGSFVAIDNFVKWPFILIFVLSGLGLAFVPLQDRSLDQWIVNFFRAVYSENQSIWNKSPELFTAFTYANLDMMKQELITLTPTSSRRKLEKFLDSQTKSKIIDPLDIQDSVYIKMVRDAFAGSAPKTKTSIVFPTQTRPVQGQKAPIQEAPAKKPPIQVSPKQPPKDDVPRYKPPKISKEETKEEPKIESQQIPKPISIKERIEVVPTKEADQKTGETQFELPKMRYEPLDPITPDQHTGRIFTSLLPKEGEIILPIRGERKLKTTTEKEIEKDIKEKADQLKDLLQQIKSEDLAKKQRVQKQVQQPEPKPKDGWAKEKPTIKYVKDQPKTPQAPQTQTPIVKGRVREDSATVDSKLKRLQKENSRLTSEIERLKKEISKSQAPHEKSEKIATLQKLEAERTRTTKNYESLKSRFAGLKQKVFVRSHPYSEIAPEHAKRTGVSPSAPRRLNIVSGVVKNNIGKELEGVVLIIKNDKGEPVRALKTNKIGHFSISTPLTNGNYTLEIDKSKKTGLHFDIIKVEARGATISSVNVVGKES